MNNKKCSFCGFINFVSAETCKKCEAMLVSASEAPQAGETYYGQPAQRYAPGGVTPYSSKSRFPILKVVAYVFAGLVVLSALSGGGVALLKSRSKVSWREYHPDGSSATVIMPNEPSRHEPIVTPLPVGTMTNHSYVSIVIGQGTAMFCYVDYTGTVFNNELAAQALDAELNDFLKRTNSTLVSKKPITYQGMTGLEFEMTPSDNLGLRVHHGYGKLLLTINRLYFFSIIAAENSDLFSGKDKFLNPTIPDAL